MSFDALAPYYRAMEFAIAGPLLHRCRTTYLTETAQTRSALLFGEGPGRYLVELLRVNSSVEVTCVDSSARMLSAAKQRAAAHGFSHRSVHYIKADWADWEGENGRFDLIATHFFLDCFREEQLAALIPRLSANGTGAAIWVVSDFRVPAAGWQRLRAKIVLKLSYTFFRLATGLPASYLTSPDPYLNASGFRMITQRLYHHGLLHADLWRRG